MKKLLSIFLSFFIILTNSFAFYDVNSNYWANGAINKWTSRGYILGYQDGTFRGDNYITRAEIITIVNKLDNSKINIKNFSSKDVSSYDWFFYDIAKANNLGFISIDKDGNIRPNDFATREETAVIISKLLGITYSGNFEKAKINNYLDKDQISSENYGYFAGMVEEGFINGYSDGTLKPKNKITRAEFVSILDNAISHIYSTGTYKCENIVGNILVNGNNVKIINSNVLSKIFITNGAKENPPEFINTSNSKNANLQIDNSTVDDISSDMTLSEYNEKRLGKYSDSVLATIKYSDIDWTNDDVTIRVSFDKENVEIKNMTNGKMKVDTNGEYEIEYIYNGKNHKISAEVNNIDKEEPILNIIVQKEEENFAILVYIKDDGLSPIEEITLSDGQINKINEEYGDIVQTFIVAKAGTYTVSAKDKAGNVSEASITFNEQAEKISE